MPPSRPVNGRYNVEPRAESPQHTAASPKSPLKTMPTAHDPAARTASSQKYIKTSLNSSAPSSPRLEKIRAGPAAPAVRHDLALRARSPNPVIPSQSPDPSTSARFQQPDLSTKTSQTLRPVRSPEPTRAARSPEPMRSAKSPEPVRSARSPVPGLSTKGSQTLRPLRSPEPTRTVRSPETVRSAQTPSPAPNDPGQRESEEAEPRAKSPDAVVHFKTPAQVMAGMSEALKPPVPERSASRRRSITEQARSLLRLKPSFQKDDENALSSTNLPIQSPSGEATPTNHPSSPTVARSLSTRKAQAMSMSTYSASPTSPTKTADYPPDRGDSPVYTRGGKYVPTQSSYGVLAFPAHSRTTSLDGAVSAGSAWLPGHSRTSSLDSPVPAEPSQQIDSPARTELPRYAKPVAALDDSEGNVNTAHPLLQKARHTRFATKNGSDLPLRHYKSQDAFTHSNPDLSERQAQGMALPKRSSSLLYNPNNRSITPTLSGNQTGISSPYPTRLSSQDNKRSPTPNQLHQNDSAISLVTRAHTAPAESELGIHPAHRTPEPPSASTAASSPSPPPSTRSSSAEQGATPPPIATVRSPKNSDATITPPKIAPPSRFAPAVPPQFQTITAPTSSNHSREPSKDYHPESNPKYKTTATNNTPFYLNPASSQALLDFLASTPPPSPPHPGTRTEPDTPTANSAGAFFNRTYMATENRGGESSPPPPFAVGRGGGSMDALPRAKTGDGNTREKKGWKKLFGGGGGKPEKQMDGLSGGREMKQKKKRDYRKNVELSQVYGVGTGAKSVDGRIGDLGKDSSGYMGLGKDGVWISRKNFLKT